MLTNPSRTGLVRRRGGKTNCPKGISTQNRKEPYDVLNETEPLKRRTGIKKNALQRSICIYIFKFFLKVKEDLSLFVTRLRLLVKSTFVNWIGRRRPMKKPRKETLRRRMSP